VYCYDTQTSSNFLISTTWSGASPNGRSDNPDISPDGRFVAYCSGAEDIIPGDANNSTDVFLYDRQNAVTVLLSLSGYGNQTADSFSTGPMFSADGRTLLFRSWASDITPGDFNGTQDIYTINLYPDSAVPLFLIHISRDPAAAQACWLTWPVVPGKTYRVQFKSSLSDPAWQEPGSAAVIVGTQGYFRDLVTGSAQRFYRVMAF
jgi:hypothetical protein